MAMARGAAVASALAVNRLDRGCTDAEAARDVEDRRVDVRRRRRGGHLGGVALGRAGSSGYSGFAAPNRPRTPTRPASRFGKRRCRRPRRSRRSRPSWRRGPTRSRRSPWPRQPAPAPAAPPVAQTMVARLWSCRARPHTFPRAAPHTYRPRRRTFRPRRPPAYVPPQPQVPAVQPEPRLRDKIIERIPIINRFHDPQPQYPTRVAASTALYMTRKANVHSLFA